MTFTHKPRQRVIEVSAVAASPYSMAMDGIRRFLEVRGGVIDIAMPLRGLGIPLGLGLSHRVKVEFDTHELRSEAAVFHDRVSLEWHPDPPGPFPSFTGRLTIRPAGVETEFTLKGYYEPPLGQFGAAFDAVIGKRIAQATVVHLLDELVKILQTEYRTLKDVMYAFSRT